MPQIVASDLGLQYLPLKQQFSGTSKGCKMDIEIHYENMPIQIYRKFHLQKTENFQIRKLIFFIFLLKTQIVGTH